ncbi:acetyl-CoA carboxylase biotin carboxyl carrier protein [Flavobacteriaceae bacterium Ap0902]|nr:acetyl-CoA carboxylase biotin carboxyl carrier protein [Flavobacteriaceae bacterium Ap0902]
MDNKEIQNLIKFVAKSGVAEVKIKDGDFAIQIKNVQEQIAVSSIMPQNFQSPPQSPPVPASALVSDAVTNAPKEKEAEKEANLLEIKSPMIGTFYRKPSPDKDVFVKVGDSVKVGDTVCVIEAMKLFNEIEAEASGKIVKVLVDDATPVEYDQPLFLVEPV